MIDILEIMYDKTVEWQQQPKERLALVALVSLLKPKNTLEIGILEGGYTRFLSAYSEKVVCVDVNMRRRKEMHSNCDYFQMPSGQYFEKIDRVNFFDLIMIDGDHSKAGAKEDLVNALDAGRVVLMHDTYNPDCRAGYSDAINENKEKIKYFDLDLISGTDYPTGKWGGIGLVVSGKEV